MPIFEWLVSLIPNVELLLIGDCAKPSLIESKRYADAAGFGWRVHTLPVIKPVEQFYATIAQCDLWIATLGDDTRQGRHEFRMELLEVGLLRKAVAAVATPGLIEQGLTDAQEILYIDPSDPQGAAAKIAALASDPLLLSQLGKRLQAYVIERFSLEKAVDDVLDAVAPGRQR